MTTERNPDAVQLAALYDDPSRPETERRAAMKCLIDGYRVELESGAKLTPCAGALYNRLGPRIKRIASSVVRNAHGWNSQDFVEDALACVLTPREGRAPLIAEYDPAQGPLEPFLRTILSRAWYSRWRQVKTTQPLPENLLSPERPDRFAVFAEPFSAAELDTLTACSPLDRILVLCLTGLWLKVPKKVWGGWAAKCGLKRPFPPPDFVRSDSPRQWLADALGIRIGVLYARFHRNKHVLTAMEGLRDHFLPDHGPQARPP